MSNALKYQWSPEEAIEKLYQKGFMDGTNVGFLQTLIDNTIEIEENAFFWQEHFRVEGNEYDVDIADLKKNPAWTVRQKINRTVPMADAMAPLSETMQLDAEVWRRRLVLSTSMVRDCSRPLCQSLSFKHVSVSLVQTRTS